MESSRNCGHKFFFQWVKIQLYKLQIVPTACQRFRNLTLPHLYFFTADHQAHPKGIFFSMLLKYCMRLTQLHDTHVLFTLSQLCFSSSDLWKVQGKEIKIFWSQRSIDGVLCESQFLSLSLSHSRIHLHFLIYQSQSTGQD